MDPMDWTHQWDNFEMYMYVVGPAASDTGDEGIFMQVSRHEREGGAVRWEILYDRKLADLDEVAIGDDEVGAGPGSEAWEEQVLRQYFRSHPELVEEEKRHLDAFLASN